MKKIAKYSLEELSKVMPTLSEKEQAGYVGGGGTFSNPFTESEYEFLLSKDLWTGGYVRRVSGANTSLTYIPDSHETYGSNSVYLGNGVFGSQYDPNKDAAIIDNEAGKKESEKSDNSTSETPAPDPVPDQYYFQYERDLTTKSGYTEVNSFDYCVAGFSSINYYAHTDAKKLDVIVLVDQTVADEKKFFVGYYDPSGKKFCFDTKEGEAALQYYITHKINGDIYTKK